MTWTAAQQRAISTVGCDVFVSAGAGSGKTAVLSERCAYLVAQSETRCRVDRLLVVTFTEAAAAEMRGRIERALRRRLSGSSTDRWLAEQLGLVDLASISTLHAFCRRTLARHFAAAGVDPGFTVLDAHEAALMRDEAADAVFEELAAGTGEISDAYDALCHFYAAGRPRRVRDVVLRVSDFLRSLPDPDTWRKHVLGEFESTSADQLGKTWSQVRRELLSRPLQDLCDMASDAAVDLKSRGGPKPMLAIIAEARERFEAWRDGVIDGNDSAIDAVCAAVVEYKLGRAPSRTAKVRELPPDELAAFDAAKDAIATIRDVLGSLDASDARFTGRQWAEGLVRIAPYVRTILVLVDLVDRRYSAAKQAANGLDFSDLEQFTLQLLQNSNETTAWLRDHFDHVLVDEFQDINPIQEAILRRISRHEDKSRPRNLFMVGDIKQSIYRFRLAEPALFLKWHSELSEKPQPGTGLRVGLSTNFRSQANVLEAVNRIMQRLMTKELGGVDYDESAWLRARSEGGPPAELPALELHLVDTEPIQADAEESETAEVAVRETDATEWERIEREAAVIGARILALRKADPSIAFRDIVILMRSPANRLTLTTRMLSRFGVPAYAERSGGFFDATEIRDVRALLSLLDNAMQDIPLAAVLRSGLCASPAESGGDALPLTDHQLVEIRKFKPGFAFHSAAVAYSQNGPEARLKNSLTEFFVRIEKWRHAARRHTVADLIALIDAETSYSDYVAALPDGPSRRANLVALHEHARQFSRFARQGLCRFMHYLDDLEERGDDIQAGIPISGAADVVRIMSIHLSKGLEFPVVFIADVGKRFNLEDANQSIILDRTAGLGLRAVDAQRRIMYPTLAHRRVAERLRLETLSEGLRLLYVALTRAKRRIIIVGSAEPGRLEAMQQPSIRATGPIPFSHRRRATSMLDWISAALALQPGADVAWNNVRQNAANLFAVARHELSSLTADVDKARRGGLGPLLARAASLAELPGAAPSAEELRGTQDQVAALSRGYHAPALTSIPSVVAVTELKKRWHGALDPDDPVAMEVVRRGGTFSPDWRQPRFVANLLASPTDRGTWTHLLMEHLDLSATCDAVNLRDQLDALVARGLLNSDQAAQIDLEAVTWVFCDDVGRRLRDACRTVRREMGFMLSVEPSRYDSSAAARDSGDFIVVRGVIDCLYCTPRGAVILDWKTDAIAPESLQERVALYGPQLDIYATAVQEMLKTPVVERRLVFLSLRRSVAV